MTVNSRLLFLVIKTSAHHSNVDAGDCVSVQPADYQPSPEVKAKMLIIDSEMTVAEAKAYWLKSGIPDDVRTAWEEEDERVRGDIVAAIAQGKDPKKDVTPFDDKKKIDVNAYKKKRVKLDLTTISQSVLDKIQAGHDCINDNRATAKSKAHEKVMTKYEEQKGRKLTDTEKAKTTKDILEEYTVDTETFATATEELAAGASVADAVAKTIAAEEVKTKDQLKDEIIAASLAGRIKIEHAELAKITLADPVAFTTAELEAATITK